MVSVAVRIEVACGICSDPIPISRLAREVSCPSCRKSTLLVAYHWEKLLRAPLRDGPALLQNEERRSAVDRLSATYMRGGPCCHGCERELPMASIWEVRGQALLRCDRCARQIGVRAVPAELAGALPNVTHLVGEDPDPSVPAPVLTAGATPPRCPRCGTLVEPDGASPASTCRCCGSSVNEPDDIVRRGSSPVAAPLYLCLHPSVTGRAPAAHAVSAGLFDWEGLPEVAVDAQGNLYCAATQSHWHLSRKGEPREKRDEVLWSIDASLNIRWLLRDRAEALRIVGCVEDKLLVIGARSAPLRWLSSRTGTPVEGPGGAAPARRGDLPDDGPSTCDRDGSLLLFADGELRRIAPDGQVLPLWRGGAPGSDADEASTCNHDGLPDRPVGVSDPIDSLHCGPDGSLLVVSAGFSLLVRFDAAGRKIYGVTLSGPGPRERRGVLGADLRGNAYLLLEGRLVRVSSTGEQDVLLQGEHGSLPWWRMRIAVCPDGSFWLFGEKGLAWRFDPEGKLVFASEREPGPRKPTREELLQQKATAEAEAFRAALTAQVEPNRAVVEEQSARIAKQYEEARTARKAQKRRHGRISCVAGVLATIIVLLTLWLSARCYSP